MKLKGLLILCFGFIGLSGFGFSQNLNRLQIIPANFTGRYYCNIDFKVKTLNNNVGHTNAIFSIEFDVNNSALSFLGGNTFPILDTGYFTGVFNNRYYLQQHSESTSYTTNIDIADFSIVNKNTNLNYTNVFFVDSNGNTPTSTTFQTTASGLTLSNTNGNTLTGVDNATYTFEMCPCSLDNTAPFVNTTTLSHPINIAGQRILGCTGMSMLFIDDGGSVWNYRYDGNLKIPANYVAGAPTGMDNQEGVNSGTLYVKIDYSSSYGSVTDEVFVGSQLSPNKYTGTISNVPTITWDNNDRGYWISFINVNTGYQVEKPVTIYISGYDNALNGNLPCISSPTLGTTSYTFNLPAPPTMSLLSPSSGSVFQDPGMSVLKFRVDDSWAGVDTGTVLITIPEILSGGQSLMSGYTYSGTELTFDNPSGLPGLGNSGGYDVTITLSPSQQPLVDSGFIQITGRVLDLAGNEKIGSWGFTTRPSCSFYGCNEILNIYIMSGTSMFLSPYQFTGDLLIATGTNPNSPYPYLTGVNNDILMCGYPWTGVIIGGNVAVEDYNGSNLINSNYTKNKVYITGLAFDYDPNTGIVTIH